MKAPEVRDRVEYAMTRALEIALARIPDRVGRSVGAALGELARAPLRLRRETVESNLRRAFPAADPRWLEAVARETYRHLGREAWSMIRLSHMTREQILHVTEVEPNAWEALTGALAEGKGALLVTGHFGNWEAAAAAVAARGLPIDAIVKRLRNPLVDAQVNAARARLGVGVIDMAQASKDVLRSLSRGHVIGIVGDQDARSAGVFVPFFGIPSSTFRGPAMFALRFGVPLFAAVARRLSDGRYRVEGERLPIVTSGDLGRDTVRVTERLNAYLEARIREDPGQYFWFHKRWKTSPPEEPGDRDNGISRTPAAEPAASAGDLSEHNGNPA